MRLAALCFNYIPLHWKALDFTAMGTESNQRRMRCIKMQCNIDFSSICTIIHVFTAVNGTGISRACKLERALHLQPSLGPGLVIHAFALEPRCMLYNTLIYAIYFFAISSLSVVYRVALYEAL